MKIGDKIPEMLGIDTDGREVKASDYTGKKLVIYFYPKDSTPGCTNEACNLRDNMDALHAQGYEVVGVSVDSAASHQKFKAKHSLPFRLVSDESHELVEAFGVWGEKTLCGRKYMGTNRTTFIIGPNGTVERIIGPRQIKVKEHAQQILI